MENETEVVDTTTSTDGDVVIEEVESTDETEQQEETQEVQEKTYSESQFKQVLARAKKAEEALKKNKPNVLTNNVPSDALIEEKILLSQGMTEELVTELKALSKVRGTSLFATQSDPIFLAIKESKEAESKAQKSKLGASKGSSTAKKEKTISSQGLSDEEHKALWREMNGR
jgi:hypothetical protein